MKIATTLFIMFMISNLMFSQDWANLQRYQKENEEVMQADDRLRKVVFMGNSITQEWVRMRPQFFKENGFVGRGISGQTTPQMLLRMRQDVIDLQPEVVVILAGTNDIAGNTGPMTLEQIMAYIKDMAELASANNIRVVLSSVLPAYDYPWRPGLEPNVKIPKLNAMIRQYCQESGYIYLDYFSAMADERNGLPKKYAEDEVHPTELGYKAMEPLVKEAIEKAISCDFDNRR